MSNGNASQNDNQSSTDAGLKPALVGGPGGTMDGTASSADAPAEKPIIVGGKTFKTLEEYTAYAQKIEQEKQGLETIVQKFITPGQGQATAQPPASTEKKVGDLLFEDPELYAQEVLARATKAAKAALDSENASRDYWNDFYQKNPDLKEFTEIVEVQRVKNLKTLEKMTAEEAAQVLAKEAKGYLAKVRGIPSGGQQLSTTPANMVGASGGPAPAAPAMKPKVTSFVDEVRALKKTRA